MTPIQNFTDLTVWTETFAVIYQTRKSVVSIPSNIAEGFCRKPELVYINNLNIALGSEGELFTQLECRRRLKIAKNPKLEKYFDDLSQVGKMLRGLVKSLERSAREQQHWGLGPEA